METKRHITTVTDSANKVLLTDLPSEIIKSIFEYLSAVDLSRVASCNRQLRCVANMDSIWRPLCLRNGWERYGNITDLTKEIPYKPQDVSGGRNDVSFNMAAIVRQDSTMDLVATCRWKEIYMKANHLENNWKNKRFHVSTLNIRDTDADSDSGSHVLKMVIDKDSLVLLMYNDAIQIWDVETETCRHHIPPYSNCVECVECLSVSDGKLALGSQHGLIRIFSTKTGEILHVMQGAREEYIDEIFIDAELVISAATQLYTTTPSVDAQDGHISVWTVEDGALRHIFKSDVQGAILRDVDYLDKMVVGAYSDKCLRLWDACTGDCLHILRYNCKGIAKSLSCCLGNGIIALADFDAMKFIIWNMQSGECVTSVSIAVDFKDLVDYGWPGKCEAVNDLVIISLYGHAECYFKVYNQKGELLINIDDLDGMGCIVCHGNKFVIQGPGETYDLDNFFIYMVVTRDSKQMRITDGRRSRLDGIDDTKMILTDFKSMTIYHYW